MHDEIIGRLARLDSLTVISRTTMDNYANSDKPLPQIARELNVETVMEGSIRHAGDRLSVALRLVDPFTDLTLWSQSYDATLDSSYARAWEGISYVHSVLNGVPVLASAREHA